MKSLSSSTTAFDVVLGTGRHARRAFLAAMAATLLAACDKNEPPPQPPAQPVAERDSSPKPGNVTAPEAPTAPTATELKSKRSPVTSPQPVKRSQWADDDRARVEVGLYYNQAGELLFRERVRQRAGTDDKALGNLHTRALLKWDESEKDPALPINDMDQRSIVKPATAGGDECSNNAPEKLAGAVTVLYAGGMKGQKDATGKPRVDPPKDDTLDKGQWPAEALYVEDLSALDNVKRTERLTGLFCATHKNDDDCPAGYRCICPANACSRTCCVKVIP